MYYNGQKTDLQRLIMHKEIFIIYDHDFKKVLVSYLHQGSRNQGGTGPLAFQLKGPCPCYFVSWPLLIEVTKDEFKHMTHKVTYRFEICIYLFVNKAQNIK